MTVKQKALYLSRELRKNMTVAEYDFWELVRKERFMGYKFLRQHPIFYEYNGHDKFFIADFYCRRLKLVVEIDGGIHESQKDYDQIRSEIMEKQHELRVMRFSNIDVMENINRVLIELRQSI